MTREQVHDLMENELRCVQRGNYCDRDCAKCPLVKDDKELIEAYGYVIKALEQESILDKIRTELIDVIQNGTLKLECGNETLFNIIDKYRTGNEEEEE